MTMAQVAIKSDKQMQPSPPPSGRSMMPWDAWDTFRGQMDRMFDSFTRGLPGFPDLRRPVDVQPFFRFDTSFGTMAPAVDVVEKDKEFLITAELPGLDEKDLDVQLSGDVLTIKGEKTEEKEEKQKNTYISERRYGSFQRSFQLPDGVDRGKVSASFEKGVLRVMLPKTADAVTQQKKIPIKSH